MRTTVQVQGAKELGATLRALPKATSRAIQRDVLLAAAEPITAVARRLAPRAPGAPDMADSIDAMPSTRKLDAPDADTVAVIVGPSKQRFYAAFVEWGTVRMSAQPFLRPAFDENRERSLAIIMRDLWTHIHSFVLNRKGV